MLDELSPIGTAPAAAAAMSLGSIDMAVLQQWLHEARACLVAEPWRAQACLDDMAELLGGQRASYQPKAMLGQQIAPIMEPEVGLVKGGLAPWQISRVRQHVRVNIDQPLNIETLAELAQLSVGHFCRAFKISMGEPPHAFVTRQRLSHAQHLMLRTTDTLGLIAPACGLADQAHLTRLFRKWFGTTPQLWRRTHAMR